MEDTLTPESARLVMADALGIELIASDLTSKKGITRAYRFAAKKHHPDMPGGSESVMRLITKARDVLLEQAR
jgi:DnaJ-class molecular chaperone